jgi:membrane protein YdbS with pleckstrin-like domain
MDEVIEAQLFDAPQPEPPDNFLATEPLNELDLRFIKKEVVAGMITLAVFGPLSLMGFAIYLFFRGLDWIGYLAFGMIVLIGLLIGFGSFVWPRLHFKHARWRLDNLSLEIWQGVLWRHKISVPLGRVQHADVSQGPLQRYFGIGKLIVHTAGTYQASVELDGLRYETALELRDRLINQTQTIA